MSKPKTKGRQLARPKEHVEHGGHTFRVDFNGLADFEEAVGQPLQMVFREGRVSGRVGVSTIRSMAFAFCSDFATKEDAGAWLATTDIPAVTEALFEAIAVSGYLGAAGSEGEA